MSDVVSINISKLTYIKLDHMRQCNEDIDDLINRLIDEELAYYRIIEPNKTRLIEGV